MDDATSAGLPGGMTDDARAPEIIDMGQHVMRIAFHRSSAILAAATVTGEVGIFEYGLEGNRQCALLQHHQQSTRALQYTCDGGTLFMGSKDCSISAYDLSRACVSGTMSNAHKTAVSCLCVVDENVLASGDDDGTVKIWDLRQAKCVHEMSEHEDYISDIQLAKDEKTLLCSGGDGYLSVWNRKSGKLVAMSDQMDDEFLSIQIMKNGRKAVLGTQSGVLAIFSWGNWGDMTDRFIGHPQSVESMVKVDEVQPNKLLGVIGEHDGYPVEDIDVSHDQTYLCSCSHDNTVKFWNIAYLYADDDEDNDEEEEEVAEEGQGAGAGGDAGMGGSESDFDSDESDAPPRSQKSKKSKGKAKRPPPGGLGFYADM